jgi:sugar phosphate isomerase/epimerase
MNQKLNIAMNSTTVMHSNLVTEIEIAKKAGYQGIEIQQQKLFRYLDLGGSLEYIRDLLEEMQVVGCGVIWNIERQGKDFIELEMETRRMCEIAQYLGAPQVQLCTGPVDWRVCIEFAKGKIRREDSCYLGLLGEPEDKVIEITAKNLRVLADIAAGFGLDLYLEPVAWAPLNRICDQGVKLIQACGKENLGFVVDFWHMWSAGETPEQLAELDKKYIKMVHICDGLEFDRMFPPDQEILRDVWIGEGDIPLKKWISAVKATGYEGWYATETFCKRAAEKDQLRTAIALQYTFEYLLN